MVFPVGKEPEDWRITNIPEEFRKNEKDGSHNYRASSLTSFPGKVREWLV